MAAKEVNAFTGTESIVIDEHARCVVDNRYIEEGIIGRRQRDRAILLDLNAVERQSKEKSESYEDLLLHVAMHEMLHSLGLKHTVHGIMRSDPTARESWSAEDLEECRRVGVCDTE